MLPLLPQTHVIAPLLALDQAAGDDGLNLQVERNQGACRGHSEVLAACIGHLRSLQGAFTQLAGGILAACIRHSCSLHCTGSCRVCERVHQALGGFGRLFEKLYKGKKDYTLP